MGKNLSVWMAMALMLLLAGLAAAGAGSGRFSVLTYNVAGLPEGISQSHPYWWQPEISPLLNDYDIVVTQEDFFYPERLRKEARHEYYEPRSRAGTLGDGLSRFSIFPIGEMTREAWEVCNGKVSAANDCLTPKGFNVATAEIAPGVLIDVYDLHMDAGGSPKDQAARAAQMEQLIRAMEARASGRAAVIGGDFNLKRKRPRDRETLERLSGLGFIDACAEFPPCEDRVDRIFYRSGGGVNLRAVSYTVEDAKFRTSAGWPLSDHEPVAVEFEWEAQ